MPRPPGSTYTAGGMYMRPGSGKLGGTWSGKFTALFRSYCGTVGTGASVAAGSGITADEAGTGPGKACGVPRRGPVARWRRKYAEPGRRWAVAADSNKLKQTVESRGRRRIGMECSQAK